ncbi:MAG: hypothetical protein NTW96_00365, partial [Planctomycetia bacterium]|nr:hypothetical protein [Planctomycetia bacterium]
TLLQVAPIILVCAIAFYVSRNGYRATTSNDRFQMSLIFLGALAVFALTVLSIHRVGWGKVAESVAGVGNPFGSLPGALMFLVETFLGFIFSQLLYYDNWQRLSFWVHDKVDALRKDSTFDLARELKNLERTVRREYIFASVPMLLVLNQANLSG